MWDFLLVLGQVPGTKFQITFLEIVLFCASAGLFLFFRRQPLRIRRIASEIIAQARSLRVKKGSQLKLPV